MYVFGDDYDGVMSLSAILEAPRPLISIMKGTYPSCCTLQLGDDIHSTICHKFKCLH